MASLIRTDLHQYRCNDGFIAQQRLTIKPNDGQKLPNDMIHLGMKDLMETLQNAVAYPPVIATNIVFDDEHNVRYQRLEWPQMLRSYGHLIMANGQKVRIQTSKPIDAPSMRQVKRASARKRLIRNGKEVGIDLVKELDSHTDCTTTWATIAEMAQMTHQADVRPACEVREEEMIEDDIIIDLDSGVSSSRTTPAPVDVTPRGRTPEVIMLPPIPVPSARAPSPEKKENSITVEMLRRVLDFQEEMKHDLEKKMDKQQAAMELMEARSDRATGELSVIKLELKNIQDQVKL